MISRKKRKLTRTKKHKGITVVRKRRIANTRLRKKKTKVVHARRANRSPAYNRGYNKAFDQAYNEGFNTGYAQGVEQAQLINSTEL